MFQLWLFVIDFKGPVCENYYHLVDRQHIAVKSFYLVIQFRGLGAQIAGR